ncbi:sugar transferase, partial [Balneolaceae bacterium ANBcel3]|nr:sugar transferase [Balneolaceae bacterium ANBcel3]
ENTPVVGSISDIQKLVSFHKIDEVLFSLPAVDYDQILKCISEVRDPSVYPRIVADSMDYMVGKTHVEYLEDLPVMEVDLPFYTIWNRTLKRLLDIGISVVFMMFLLPFFLIPVLLNYTRREQFRVIYSDHSKADIFLFLPYSGHKWKNRLLLYWYVFRGKISLVGAPLIGNKKPHFAHLKPGITGPGQLSETRLHHDEERANHELYYLQNYSIWMDLDLLLKTLLLRKKTLKSLDS